MKAKRLLSLLLTAALMLSMVTPVLAASAETELPRASQTRLEETNEVVSIRLQAAGKLVYGSPFELSVVTRPADAQYIGVVLGGGAYFAGEGLLRFYSTDDTVIAAGLARMRVICTSYFLCGVMDTLASCLRGRGYSVLPMVVSLIGSCLLRLVWIATIFQLFRSTTTLYISYPISWVLTASVHLICLLVVRHKLTAKQSERAAA